jgi:precorrin-6x reductase
LGGTWEARQIADQLAARPELSIPSLAGRTVELLRPAGPQFPEEI